MKDTVGTTIGAHSTARHACPGNSTNSWWSTSCARSTTACSRPAIREAAGARQLSITTVKHRDQVERLKFINTHSTSALAQQGVAAYLANDGWDHHLRGVRQTLVERSALMRSMVRRFFPEGTRMSQPQGGYLLWVELPKNADTLALYREALARGISIAPGRVFSNSDLYGNFLRINYSHAWTPQIEEAVKALARMANHACRVGKGTGLAEALAPRIAR